MNPGTAPGTYEHNFKKKIVKFCEILQEMNRAIIANNALPDKEMFVAPKFVPLHKLDSCIGFIAVGHLI